ncbi:unnamed protein product [Nesidiocoris tenuis]|uniref:Nuclear pore complex protein Nup153 n=1 Tax=Nesidiocoris tenuis TaxID=355587 RepID=A0A6H5FYW6_9HEMI|nr:unnamed protein product [Nesidiocoris tenuis]
MNAASSRHRHGDPRLPVGSKAKIIVDKANRLDRSARKDSNWELRNFSNEFSATRENWETLIRYKPASHDRPTRRTDQTVWTDRFFARRTLAARRFLFTTRNRSTDMSNSFSRKRPTFDIHAFNNPLNKSSSSLNSTLNNQTLQSDRLSSPFYRGRTMYGGSSSCVDSLSLSVVAASPKVGAGAKRVCVRPTATPSSANQCEISTTAEQILRAIEQFSSPVTNVRKIPVKSDSSNRKRKALPIPFEDLVIPTVPDLLRMKRKERAASESSASSAVPTSAAASAAAPVSSASTASATTGSSSGPTTAVSSAAIPSTVSSAISSSAELSAAVSSAASPAVTSSVSGSSPSISFKYYQLPPPIQPLSTRDDEDVAKKVAEAPKTEKANAVPLPAVSLPVPTSPTFRSSLPATATTSTRPRVSSSSSEYPVFSVSTVSSAPTFTLSFTPNAPPKAAQKPSQSEFKFSSPIECEKPLSATATKPNLKFRDPQDAKSQLTPVTNHSVAFKSPPPSVLKAKSPVTKSPVAKSPVAKSPVTKDPILKTVPDKSLGSAANFFKTAPQNDTKANSLQDKFKPASGNWTCDTCLVSNPPDKLKCCCCETPKPGKALDNAKTEKCGKCLAKIEACSCSSKAVNAKAPLNSLKTFAKSPSSNWECSTCLVSNKSSDAKCVACSAAKPGSVAEVASNAAKDDTPKAVPSLNALFKKDAKSWECSVCMVNNKAADNACVACGEKNPKAPAEAKPAPKFTFGIPPGEAPTPAGGTGFSSPAPFSFGVSEKKETKVNAGIKLPNNVEPSGFTFGKRTADESQKNDQANSNAKEEKAAFTFGKNESISTSFQFQAPKGENSIFGSTSNAASSSTDAKAPTEKFGSISTGVSSTTDPATLQAPSSNFGIFGQNPPTTTSNSSIFGADKKPAAFGGASNSGFLAGSKPFGVQAETEKTVMTEPGAMFVMPSPRTVHHTSDPKGLFSPKKGFFNQTESTENKSIFGGLKPDFGASKPDLGSAKPDFGSAKPDFGSAKPDFGSAKPDFGKTDFTAAKPAFDLKPNDGFHVFGSQTTVNSSAANEQPKTFSSSPFVFKGSEPAKPSGGFSFPAPNSAPTNAFGFNSAPETPAPMFGSMAAQPAAQTAPMFGSMAQPMFNSAPQTNATPAPFAFGAQPQQQVEPAPAPAFGFPAAPPQVIFI